MEVTTSSYGVYFCGDDSVIKLIEVMFAQLCKNTKNYWIVYFIESPRELLKFTKVKAPPKTKQSKNMG